MMEKIVLFHLCIISTVPATWQALNMFINITEFE